MFIYFFFLELPGFKNTGQATKWLQNKSLGGIKCLNLGFL